MGDMFASNKAQQTTTNRQVGVQGTGALGISGNIGAGAFGGSSTVIRTGKNSRVNLTTSDFGAINAARDVQLAALSSNQTVALASVGASQSVAEQSINAANQATINALDVVRGLQSRQADLTETAVGASTDLAQQVAPGGNVKFVVIGVAATAIIIAIIIAKKRP